MALMAGPWWTDRGVVVSARQVRSTNYHTEKALDDAVRQLLAFRGYTLVFHHWLSIHSRAGWPDIVAIRTEGRPRTVFLELKGARGRVSAAQQETIDALKLTGLDARIVWPEELQALADWLA